MLYMGIEEVKCFVYLAFLLPRVWALGVAVLHGRHTPGTNYAPWLPVPVGGTLFSRL